jgi:hypothetical protein
MRSSDVEKARGKSFSLAVDEKRMNRNARDAGNSVAWEQTKFTTPRGGEQLGVDIFRAVDEQVRRNNRSIAMDLLGEIRTDRLHRALDQLIHEGEEPEEESAFSMDALQRQLDAIADDDDEDEQAARSTVERAEYLSAGQDAAPKKKICCTDCATLAGLKGAGEARRRYEARRARLV